MPRPKLLSLATASSVHANLEPSGPTEDIPVLFVTDRVPVDADSTGARYGSGRSHSMAFGQARIAVRAAAEVSDGVTRPGRLRLNLVQSTELGRAPPSPHPFVLENGLPVIAPEIMSRLERISASFKAAIKDGLSQTSRREAFIYVHGIQNTFAESVFATGELWHYLGREGIPIAYSWPAGGGGLLRGYTYDRESGEFTVYHLKVFLKVLTSIPELEGIHLITHSRGTDVVINALRELVLEAYARGEDPHTRYRIRNLVLAAPDLDLDVMLQRTFSERLSAAVGRLTIYASPRDKALGLTEFLFGGFRRLGQATFSTLPEHVKAQIRPRENVALIAYTGTNTGEFGHSYFKTNPAVASDLILTVRFNRDPGAENGRPLTRRDAFYWEIDDDYLDQPAPDRSNDARH